MASHPTQIRNAVESAVRVASRDQCQRLIEKARHLILDLCIEVDFWPRISQKIFVGTSRYGDGVGSKLGGATRGAGG